MTTILPTGIPIPPIRAPSGSAAGGVSLGNFQELMNQAVAGRDSPLSMLQQPLDKRAIMALTQAVSALMGTGNQAWSRSGYRPSSAGGRVDPLPKPTAASSAAISPFLLAAAANRPTPPPDSAPKAIQGTGKPPPAGNYDEIIRRAAAANGLDEQLLRSVITVESNFDPRAVSRAGAMGLMQLMPGTARELGVTDPFDPEQNIQGGARYLSTLMERYDGNQSLALAAYNWGMGNLERRPEAMPSETRNYVAKISSLMNQVRG